MLAPGPAAVESPAPGRALPAPAPLATYSRRVTSRRRDPGADTGAGAVPRAFADALAGIRAVTLRPEIVVEETPAPLRLSPYALALQAEVVVDDEEAATGRFVLLHDPVGQEPWEGDFRIVSFVKGAVELEIAQDPLLTQVGWSWLLEALESRDAAFHAESGTVTRTASESFGGIADRGPSGDVEIRASWTPSTDDIGAHLAAWGDVLAQVAGLPPLPAGVAALPRPRRR
ncbi:MAG: DUF3000 family protein [Frankiales bacterium]|nr:DUF3000 family protein [Frankiales bacterium]